MCVSMQVSTRGAVLYFSILGLKHLGAMYQFSVAWFNAVFAKCIREVKPNATVLENDKYGVLFQDYLHRIIQYLTSCVCEMVALSLSSEHYLPFIFKFCCSMLTHGDQALGIQPTISSNEWLVMLQPSKELQKEAAKVQEQMLSQTLSLAAVVSPKSGGHHLKKYLKVEKPDFLSKETWESLAKLEKLVPELGGLLKHISEKNSVWKAIVASNDPWKFEFPSEILVEEEASSSGPASEHSSLKTTSSKRRKSSTGSTLAQRFTPSAITRFQRLLLIKLLSPNHLSRAVKSFIAVELGPQYTVKAVFDLRRIFEQSSNKNPVLFILAPGN